MTNELNRDQKHKVGWLAGVAGAAAGVITVFWRSGSLSTPIFLLILLVPAVLAFEALRRVRAAKLEDRFSGPLWRYYRDFWIATSLYVLGISVAIVIWNNTSPGPGVSLGLAALPTLPTWAMIYVIARYLREETDEFLRQRAVHASVIGLGLVLVLGSFWGFMEVFEVVPNIWAWWVVPVWAVGMGLGQTWMSWRDRSLDEAQDDEA
ncbi:MAG: hypothetical protein AAF707_02290 [Pseudomonadota bacterium]